ncbi:MAG: efflux RND transporter periplasmic adaptor subunit [Desulfobacteraceae bacterium]|nr:MAG: efflux RND transporter periplasmic adaptor subunit [Desulfobacteraceae bacterium]
MDKEESDMKRKFITYGLPILIIIIGFLGMRALVLSKVPPEKQPAGPAGILVKTIEVKAVDYPVSTHATGTVQSAVSVNILPQVSGKVVDLNRNFEEGGFVRKGELLFRIEDTDYRFSEEKSRASIAKTEVDLANVESQARIAQKEWDRIHREDQTEPNPLVLYKPQLKNAQAALAAAQADLQQRMLDRERTKIYAPFNCRVRTKKVDKGQFIAAGQHAATVVGTDQAEVVVPVPMEELQWLNIPREKGDIGSSAEVRLSVGGSIYKWKGVLARSMGEVDAAGRMIRLIVTVEDPYNLKKTNPHDFQLAEGLFTDVIIQGRTIDNVLVIPSYTLRNRETIWGVGTENVLEIFPVQVVRREKDVILIRSEIQGTYRIISTNISGAAQGMRLRIAGEERS